MRSVLLMLTIALAGCGDNSSSAADLAMPDLAMPDLAARVCRTACDACAAPTVCVTPGGNPIHFGAVCLVPCQSSADCGRVAACVEVDGWQPAGRYCVHDEVASCSGQTCSPPGNISERCDGNVLVSPYAGFVCGTEYRACTNGCSTTPDDGGVGAHCS